MVAAFTAWASSTSLVPAPTRAIARRLVCPAPFPPLAGWAILTASAAAPHRTFVKLGRHVVLRLAQIPRVRRLLQRKWPIWGKLLLKNKMRAEVTSYRLAINEAWEVLEGTLPQDTLRAMRAAESNIAGYASSSGGGGSGGGGVDVVDGGGGGGGGKSRDASGAGSGALGWHGTAGGSRGASVPSGTGNGRRGSDSGLVRANDPGSGLVRTNFSGPGLGRTNDRGGRGRFMHRGVTFQSGDEYSYSSGGRSVGVERIEGAHGGSGGGGWLRHTDTNDGGQHNNNNNNNNDNNNDHHHQPGRPSGDWVAQQQLLPYQPQQPQHSQQLPHQQQLQQRAPGLVSKIGVFSRHLSRRLLISAPSSLLGVLTGREAGAELLVPPPAQLALLSGALSTQARAHFTRAQHAAFLLQYSGDVHRASAAMERSLQWRRRYRYLSPGDLRRFEDVVFVHGKRSAYTGGVHLVFRLSAVGEAERTEGLDAVAAALVSHVEAQWAALGVQGDAPGKLRGRLIALVDCAGVTPGSFPASLVAHTLVTLDSNYPELAAEVHVVNVWWLVKRGLTALLEATSASTRRRVRIYRNDDTGAEKLGIRFAPHALPACFPRGRCACKTCRKITAAAAGAAGGAGGGGEDGGGRGEEFAHGGLTGRYRRWGSMSSAQRRQYVRHLSIYYLGLVMFWPMHIFRLNVHPLLVTIMRAQKLARGFLERLRRGDAAAACVVGAACLAWVAFAAAALAWWAEFGGSLLLESVRHPPTTRRETWEVGASLRRSVGLSVERSLGLRWWVRPEGPRGVDGGGGSGGGGAATTQAT